MGRLRPPSARTVVLVLVAFVLIAVVIPHMPLYVGYRAELAAIERLELEEKHAMRRSLKKLR